MLDKWSKVSVAKEQSQAVFDAACRDERINGLADGNPLHAQCPEIPRSLDRYVATDNIDLLETTHQPERLVEIALAGKPLEYLGQNDIANQERLVTEQAVKPVCLGG